MAGKNSLFRTMKAKTGGALTGLVGLLPGTDLIATSIAAFVTAFQTFDGKAAIPMLDQDGNIPVSLAGSGICLRGASISQAGTDTLATLTGGEISLTVDKAYNCVEVLVSAMSESCFQLVQNDDGVETILAEYQVGPGQYTVCCKHECMEFTAGSSGTQQLLLKGLNFSTDEASDLKGQINVKQPSV